ncbi:hypothetical protein [Pseudomonas sp. RL]|uniref:hypothetical protein n=1 Tax=Pseudomonas sp. RL TaxID=1452718 RepID=UPI0012DF6AD6|nr:hypothetical protein [Pseudomonas sp. RL]
MRLKLFALICTAFPGLQKLLLVAAGILFWGLEGAGTFSEEFAIVYFFSLFAALGYGAKLLKELPRLTPKEGVLYYRTAIGNCVLMVVLLISIFYVLDLYFEWLHVEVTYHLFLFSVANAVYQLCRHAYLARREYSQLFIVDTLFFLLSVMPIVFLDLQDYLKWVSISLCAMVLLGASYSAKGISFSMRSAFDKEPLQFSVNNIAGGGVGALLPKVIAISWSKETAALFAFYYSILSVMNLLSRAFVNYKIPELSLLIHNGEFRKIFFINAKKFNLKIVIVSFFVGIFLYLPATFIVKVEYFSVYSIGFNFYCAIMALVVTGSLGLVDGAFLFLKGAQRHNIESNLMFFTIFVLISSAVPLLSLDVWVYLALIAVASFLRVFYLAGCVIKYLE